MVIDLDDSYENLKSEISSVKSYTEAKTSLQEVLKNQGDNLESLLSKGQVGLDELKKNAEKIKQDTKNQFSQLFDINTLTKGKGKNTVNYLKNKFIQTIEKKKPEIRNLIIQEIINAINCDSEQEFISNEPVYINVNSIDFFKQLQIDPNTKRGKIYYEKKSFNASDTKKSLNKELYNRTQNINESYQNSPNNQGLLYKGASGQDLFNITFVESDGQGNSGQFFKVELSNRLQDNSGPIANKVSSFIVDYYQSIDIIESHLYAGKITDLLTGALSVQAGTNTLDASLKMNKFITRILGLCFDSATEIDVQGSSKIPELDGIDEDFFELTSLNLRQIEEERTKFLNGIIELTDCDNAQLPVDSELIFQNLEQILSGTSKNDELELIQNLTDSILSNLEKDKYINSSVNLPAYQLSLNTDFLKNLPIGLVMSVLSPKVILPLMIMIKSLTQAAGENIDYLIDNVGDFFKKFKKLAVNLISKIVSIFIKELFEQIKKDIFELLQVIVKDLAKEKASTKIIMITKLVQLLIVVASFISDYRQCKSVIDELLKLFRIATTGLGSSIPLPLLFASQALDGYSYTRAFLNTLEELQKLGIPTGSLPSGAPNKFVLAKLAQMKSMAEEEAANGKVQIAIPALAVAAFGGGTTIPSSAYGKKF